MAAIPLTGYAKTAAYVAMLLGIIATFVTAYQFSKAGFNWVATGADAHIFSWHPTLMVAAWMGSAVHAAFAYRVWPVSHDTAKSIHAAFHVLTLILWSIALAAIVKSKQENGMQQFYSLHSWFGLATIALFCLNVAAQSIPHSIHISPQRRSRSSVLAL